MRLQRDINRSRKVWRTEALQLLPIVDSHVPYGASYRLLSFPVHPREGARSALNHKEVANEAPGTNSCNPPQKLRNRAGPVADDMLID